MKYICLTLLLTLSDFATFCQTNSPAIWSPRVIDQNTSNPIGSATISINRRDYFPASPNGIFNIEIEKLHVGDSLFVTCVGYYSSKIAIKNKNNLPNTFELAPASYQLEDVVIQSNQPILKEIIVGSKFPIFSLDYLTQFNESVGIFIANSDHHTGYITSLTIKMHNHLGGMDKPFRIKIYAREKNSKYPGKEITEEIIAQNQKKEKYFTIDIADRKVSIPDDGFFIVFDVLSPSFYSNKSITKVNYHFNELPSLYVKFGNVNKGSDQYSISKALGNWIIRKDAEFQIHAKLALEEF